MQSTTTGSTGKPVTVYRTRRCVEMGWALSFLNNEWLGWEMGTRVARIWAGGNERWAYLSSFQKLRHKIFHRTIHLDAFDLSEARMDLFAQRLLQFKPQILVGYSNSLYHFALFLKESKRQIIRPKAIIMTAEPMLESHKEYLEEVFGAKVYNRYATREVGNIACECPERQGLHINAVTLFVEFFSQNTGEMGEVIVTDLLNEGMPLIRYRLEDWAERKGFSCSCGRGLPLMTAPLGRTNDVFVTEEGTKVDGIWFSHEVFRFTKGIKLYKVVQKKTRQMEISIVPKDERVFADVRFVERVIRAKFGDSVDLRFLYVPRISSTGTGKFCFHVSEITDQTARGITVS